ncbi:hypothetical protein [Microvirga sp. TS319]|uniref:hypothetical protein n=1 Tax=Microvirga sp. TS319 TaxID=3241165 RepID=UPI003519FF54
MRAFEGLLRALVERLATLPDFFVAEVRLDAAAARFVVLGAAFLAEDFAVLRAVDFAVPRAVDFAVPRVADLRAGAERAVEARAVVLRAVVLRAVDVRAADFLAADLGADFAAVFFAAVFVAVDFLAAVFLAADFTADLAEVLLAAVFLAAVFVAEDFAADLVEVFLAAVFLAAPVVPAFFVLLRADEVLAFFALVLEPFLAPLLFVVLVAPVSPVNNAVSGFLLSVGIAASFKGLRVQPSRLQGNVVIPSGFRITESVESRIRTFSVDT